MRAQFNIRLFSWGDSSPKERQHTSGLSANKFNLRRQWHLRRLTRWCVLLKLGRRVRVVQTVTEANNAWNQQQDYKKQQQESGIYRLSKICIYGEGWGLILVINIPTTTINPVFVFRDSSVSIIVPRLFLPPPIFKFSQFWCIWTNFRLINYTIEKNESIKFPIKLA